MSDIETPDDGAFVWWAVDDLNENNTAEVVVVKPGPNAGVDVEPDNKLNDTRYYARNPGGLGTPQPWNDFNDGDAKLENVTIRSDGALVTEWSR